MTKGRSSARATEQQSRPRPLQNRVAPTGELLCVAARGLMMGNRGGQFHKPDQTLGRRRWSSRAWIACLLAYKGWHEAVWVDRHYTQLFFLDEATALAAGHRPCALCRRKDYKTFAGLWAETKGFDLPPKAVVIDDVLHGERRASSSDPAPMISAADLPEGGFVQHEDAPSLAYGGFLHRWTVEGYQRGPKIDRSAQYPLITPLSIVGVLRAGYRPMLHPSANA